MKGCRCSLGSIGQRLAALFGQCVRDHCWHGDQSFGQYGYSRREKQGESRPWLTAIAPHRGYWPFSLPRSRVPIHQAPSAGNLLLADPEHPNTWYLAGTHRLEPSVAIGSRSEIIRADRQHAASARARVRDRSHNARLVQGLVVVREDQGDHQANELTAACDCYVSLHTQRGPGLGPRRGDDAE